MPPDESGLGPPMTSPRFSVVLPTRNRPETLRYALQTCLQQDFDDYEVLVCDNGDGQAARDVVHQAASTRIRYLEPTVPLAMSANWERALGEARGEFITVLGDDDGLMPFALREADRLLRDHGTQALVWQRGIYTWPTIGIDGEANLLRLPLAREVVALDGREQIAKAIRFEAGYDTLPMVYSAFVHRDLVERHRRIAGRVFLNVYPDVYSAFGLGYLAGRYLSTSVPMSIAGLSHASNGVATLMNTSSNVVANDFTRLNEQFGYFRHPKVPDRMALGPVHVIDCFLHAKDALFPDDDSLTLDRKDFTRRCLAAVFDATPERRADARQAIRSSLADAPELLAWFDAEAPDFPPARMFSFQPPRLGFDGVMLSIRTDAAKVRNIADAVASSCELLGMGGGNIINYDLASWSRLHESVGALTLSEERARRDEANAQRLLTDAGAAVERAESQLRDARNSVEQLRRQLASERDAAADHAARLQHQLGEALLASSLRYVPRRILAKLLRRLPGRTLSND
ncbi:glycosyltransferase family 2 protein [Xenophilus aerolatus]